MSRSFTARVWATRLTLLAAMLIAWQLASQSSKVTQFFIGTPFVLLFIVRDWRVLGSLFAGAAFVWPIWRILENNRPRSYDPRHPPTELME